MPSPRRHSPSSLPSQTSQLAIWSLILSLLGFCAPGPCIAAIICGHLGLSRIKKSDGSLGGSGLAIAGLIIGYIEAVVWIVLLILFAMFGFAIFNAAELIEEQSTEPFPISATEVPGFPPLPEIVTLEPSGVQVSQVDLPGKAGLPGSDMTFRVYLPAGTADPGTLPCVLIAPAGTNLLSGAGLEALDEHAYHDETLPYAEAGIVAVLYSIDGEDPEEEDGEARAEEMKTAYQAFQSAGAGTVNGRNAFQFVLSRLPMVDRERIYSAGHSSAATLSLLLAAHEPRLKGCLAYAPAVDIEDHFADMIDEPGIGLVLPGFRHFAKRSSPLTHTGTIGMPVFLFFAEDDRMVDPISAKPFIEKLKSTNADVTVQTVPSGGHYQSMIDDGIPAGIRWIQQQGSAPPPESVEK